MIKPLTELGIGNPGIVTAIRGSVKEVSSLKDLGLHLGSQVKVLHGKEGDSIMVAVGDAASASTIRWQRKFLFID